VVKGCLFGGMLLDSVHATVATALWGRPCFFFSCVCVRVRVYGCVSAAQVAGVDCWDLIMGWV